MFSVIETAALLAALYMAGSLWRENVALRAVLERRWRVMEDVA